MLQTKNPTPRYKYIVLTADGVINALPGVLHRVFVSASSSGVISIYDNASAASGTKIVDALAVAAKDSIEINAFASNGLYLDLVSGTATLTIMYA